MTPPGGCDDPIVKPETASPYPWTREHPAIDIVGFDGVSENGQEIYNFCKQEGTYKIVLMGVHTNLHFESRVCGPPDDAARFRGGAGAGPYRLDVRSAHTAIRQPRTWDGVGNRVHREDVVSLDP
jgi:hypothetical protein